MILSTIYAKPEPNVGLTYLPIQIEPNGTKAIYEY